MDRALEDAWREVSPYLDEMLDLDPEARPAWLKDLEARHPAIGARVRGYLSELKQIEAENFLGTPAASLLGSATLVGQRFGSYTLDRLIGHGGTGTVWLAHRSDGRFEGQAAVKLLNAALVGHPSELRFEREGSVLAKLRHPNIAQLLDAGVAAGNQPYLVLEYVRGERIDLYCEQHNLDLNQRIALFLDVLAAVAHAHQNLIVHRDLKPPNILVTENGSVKLLDFGVAALLAPAAQDSGAPLTYHIVPGLTPGYAAPEQLLGQAVTTATDVYALALVLFVLLAGRHPAEPEGKSAAELIKLTLDTESPRPSTVATDTSRCRLLRGDLDNILAMALRRNPAERYSTVELFAQDLRRYLALEPVDARPRSFRYVAAKFARRHRGGVAIAVVVTAVLIAAVVVSMMQLFEARVQRDFARFQTRRAEATKDFLELLMMSDLAPGQPAPNFHQRLELGVNLINKQYSGDPKFAGRMLVELAGGFRDDQEIKRANELFEEAYQIGRQQHDAELMAAAQCGRAYGDVRADIPDGVRERIAEGLRLLEQVDYADPGLRAGCLMAQSLFEQQSGHSPLAEAALKRAKSLLEAEGMTNRQDYVMVLNDLSLIYSERNQPIELFRTSQLIGQIHEANGRGGTDARLIARQNAATALNAMGESRAALAEREIVSRRAQELEGDAAPMLFAVNHATSLSRMARPAEALKVLEGVLERARNSGDRSVLTLTRLQMGAALIQLERWSEAELALKEAASLTANGIGNRNSGSLIESLMAQMDMMRGDLNSAQRHSDKALQLAGYRTGAVQRSLARVLLIGSRVTLAQGADKTAEQLARDALAINEKVARGPDTSGDVGEALLRLAQAKVSQGSNSSARPLLERAEKCLTNGLAADHPLTVEARKLLAEI